MNPEQERELEAAIKSDLPLADVVSLLRRFKDQGIAQGDVYAILERWHLAAPNEAADDRILEVADFVAGFCSPQMRIWDADLLPSSRRSA